MYCGVLATSIDGHARQLPWHGVWPLVPMDARGRKLAIVDGRLMAPAAYFDTFALSPGLAFRNTHAFRVTMGNLPHGLHIYQERLFLAVMGLHGPIVCDPMTVGLIAAHAGQEGKRLLSMPGEELSQYNRLRAILDSIVPNIPGWEHRLAGWLAHIAPARGKDFLAATAGRDGGSPCLAAARKLLDPLVYG
jgi:hypothetical protein